MKNIIFPRSNYIFLTVGLIVLIFLIELSTNTRIFVEKNVQDWPIPEFLKQNLSHYLAFIFAVIPLFICELLLPNHEHSKDHSNGILFWILYLQGNYLFSVMAVGIVDYFHIGPIFHFSFETISKTSFLNPLLLNVGLIILSLLIFDFFYNWFHRTQHTVQFFWEFHKMHHSIKNLNSIVSYHHFLEELFRIPFILLPLAVLIKIDAPTVALLSAFYATYGQFIHMNSKLSLGPLRKLFADNYYHRIHHSIAEEHYNKNYSAFFPVWDILFKTAHFPKAGEFPAVGLVDEEQPKTLREYLLQPKPFRNGFRIRLKSLTRFHKK